MARQSKLVEKLKGEAMMLLNKGEQIAAVFNKASHGLFMYKKKPSDKFKVAYACNSCNFETQKELELKPPYTVNCGQCNTQIYKQEKAPGPRGRKKKS